MTHKPSTSIFGLALIAPDKMGGEGGGGGGEEGCRRQPSPLSMLKYMWLNEWNPL